MNKKILTVSLVLILSIFLIFFLSAQNRNSKFKQTILKGDVLTINIDKVEKRNNILFSQIFKNVKVLPLETKKECLIGNIDQILVENETIYVLDRQIARSLFVFDKTGKFIRKIGKLGNGPGEYINPRSFAIDKKNKRINVYGSGKIVNYSLSGEHISTIRIRQYGAKEIASDNGTLYVDHFPIPSDNNSTLLTSYDIEGEISDTWLPYLQYNHGFQHHIGRASHLVKTPNDIKYIRPFFDTTFSIRNQELMPFIAITTEHGVSQKEMKKINSMPHLEVGKYFGTKADYYKGPLVYTENKKLIMIQFHCADGAPFCLLPPGSKKYILSNLQDDLTNRTIPFAKTVTDNSFIATTDRNYTNWELLENIRNGSIELTASEMKKISNLEIDSNPVILFYECKDKFFWE